MCRNRPDALNLVGRDGYSQSRTADEQGAVAFARGDQLGGCGGDVWVGGGLVFGVVGDANVRDGSDARVGGEVGFDFVFVVDAGVL